MSDRPSSLLGDKVEFGLRLRRLRTRSGLSGRELAARTGLTQSHISRLERAASTPTTSDVERLSAALGLDQRTRRQLSAHAHSLFLEVAKSRSGSPIEFFAGQERYSEFEKDSVSADLFYTWWLHGLLQTEDYAASVISANAIFLPPSKRNEHVESNVHLRMRRQNLLEDQSRRFHFRLGEAALFHSTVVDERAMKRQRQQLLEAMELDNVTISIVPAKSLLSSNMTLAVSKFRGRRGKIVTEGALGRNAAFSEGSDEFRAHEQMLAEFDHEVLGQEETRRLLKATA